MRIQARLFTGTALLVLALTGVQWWLHQRQLRAMQRELATVATSVGEQLLTGDKRTVLIRSLDSSDMPMIIPSAGGAVVTSGKPGQTGHRLIAIPGPRSDDPEPEPASGSAPRPEDRTIEMQVFIHRSEAAAAGTGTPAAAVTPCLPPVKLRPPGDEPEQKTEHFTWHETLGGQEPPALLTHQIEYYLKNDENLQQLRELKFEVVDSSEDDERYLVVTGEGNFEERIPLPLSPTSRVLQSSLRQGIGVSTALLLVGLVASGLLSRQLARPLQDLADGADTLARGDLGVQVPVTTSGEVGELQRAFNRMSQRLAELESEREGWRRREHLVQLGDLARGLAHTVRNPLNTLGLTVEELAGGQTGSDHMVSTARAQIRRIDRWLRSFLALGAGDAAASEETDLAELTQAVVLEAVQQGAPVRLDLPEQVVPVQVVPTALRAALANLLENAVQASPQGAPVEVAVASDGERATVALRDHGPGLPEEVRQRLFAPHVTTKVGGSGMGLFLAQQLVVSMHGGTLQVEDAPGGGTMVTVQLPLSAAGGE